MLKGWYPSEALTQLLILAALGAVFAVIAVRRYGDTLE
jgi:ABC-2 type transport system permease protein